MCVKGVLWLFRAYVQYFFYKCLYLHMYAHHVYIHANNCLFHQCVYLKNQIKDEPVKTNTLKHLNICLRKKVCKRDIHTLEFITVDVFVLFIRLGETVIKHHSIVGTEFD